MNKWTCFTLSVLNDMFDCSHVGNVTSPSEISIFFSVWNIGYSFYVQSNLYSRRPSWSWLYGISDYHHYRCAFEPCSWRGALDTTLCDQVCQWLSTGWWFSPISSTNKTDRHDITEILLKVALNTINQTKPNHTSRFKQIIKDTIWLIDTALWFCNGTNEIDSWINHEYEGFSYELTNGWWRQNDR